MSLRAGDAVGDYKILHMIGAGGMGQVFQAEQLITGRLEALKVVLKETADAPDIGARFLREIRVHASLNHPNIVSVYNAFWAGDELVMVMEWIDGEPLDSLLKLGPLPLSRAVDLAGQALQALHYAHSRGVTHRDVSPHNILISSRGMVKLMDFGLAVQPTTDVRLTQSGVPVGSLAYMAPEQVRNGAEAHPKSDLYSIGVVLYQMLTGRRPFHSENGFEIMRAHIEQAPPPVRQWAAHIPQAVEDVVMKALAKDPAHRFATADDFRLALIAAANPPTVAQAPQPASAGSFTITLPAALRTPLAAVLCGVVVVGLAFAASRVFRSDSGIVPPVAAAEQTQEEAVEPATPGSKKQDPDQLRAGPSAENMIRSTGPAQPERPRQVRSNPPRMDPLPAHRPDPPARPADPSGKARIHNLER